VTNENRGLSEADLDYLATKDELEKFKKAVVKSLKSIRAEIADLWTRINLVDDTETQIADEAVSKAERAARAVRRLEKRVKELEEAATDDED
jgi:prefoldin subunit 5